MLRLIRVSYSAGEEPFALSRYIDNVMLLSVLCSGGLDASFSTPGLMPNWKMHLSITPSWKTHSFYDPKPI